MVVLAQEGASDEPIQIVGSRFATTFPVEFNDCPSEPEHNGVTVSEKRIAREFRQSMSGKPCRHRKDTAWGSRAFAPSKILGKYDDR
jgi:hypothetical protein